MAILSWGSYKAWFSPLTSGSASAWTKLPAAVEDSTTLTTTAGDVVEAKIEGGENEAVRTKANSYTLEFSIRLAKDTDRPFTDVDGVIAGEYAFKLQPEDATAMGITIDKCTVSLEESYTTADGIVLKYVLHVLKPASGNMVKFAVVTDPTAGE